MSAPPERPSFKQIYREQYRKDSASTTTRIFRFITPAGLLIAAIFSRHAAVISIILGALAVLLFAVAIVWDRRQRRKNAAGPEGGAQRGEGGGPA